MSAKQVITDEKVNAAKLSASKLLLDAVGGTMGPEGNCVAIQGFDPKITKDGVTVAEAITVSDPVQNIMVQSLTRAAKATVDEAGDGTTCTIVIAGNATIVGNRYVVAGMDPMGIARGMRLGVDAVVQYVKEMSKPCTDSIAIEQVGTISSNGDVSIGKMLASAMEQVGKDGVIMVQEGNGIVDELELQTGMQYDRGYLSTAFITNPQERTVELENPYILLVDKKLSSFQDLMGILEKVVKQNRALLIVADGVESEALTLLVWNRIRGGAKVCAVRMPGFGDNGKAILEDIAVFTKGTVISESVGLRVENAEIEHLGTARRVLVTDKKVTIIEGSGEPAEIDARVAMLKKDYNNETSSYEKEKKQERLAKLSGGIAVVKVGAPTELEMKEKKDRLEDALNATRAAIEEGIVPGGGVALLRASKILETLKGNNEDEDAGIAIIRESIRAPLYRIIQNTGREPAVIAHEILNGEGKSNVNYGYDAAKGIYGDMVAMGIIDPTKVVRTALQKAESIASVLLNVRCIIADLPKDESAQTGGMGGGMNGMSGNMDMM
jgi:chaperonin GroEL